MRYTSILLVMLVLGLLAVLFLELRRRPLARAEIQPASLGLRLDLNVADSEQLTLLPDVGPATAGSIVNYRREHGPFRSVDDLRKVHGIGVHALQQIQPYVFVSAPDVPRSPDTSVAPATPLPPATQAAPITPITPAH